MLRTIHRFSGTGNQRISIISCARNAKAFLRKLKLAVPRKLWISKCFASLASHTRKIVDKQVLRTLHRFSCAGNVFVSITPLIFWTRKLDSFLGFCFRYNKSSLKFSRNPQFWKIVFIISIEGLKNTPRLTVIGIFYCF